MNDLEKAQALLDSNLASREIAKRVNLQLILVKRYRGEDGKTPNSLDTNSWRNVNKLARLYDEINDTPKKSDSNVRAVSNRQRSYQNYQDVTTELEIDEDEIEIIVDGEPLFFNAGDQYGKLTIHVFKSIKRYLSINPENMHQDKVIEGKKIDIPSIELKITGKYQIFTHDLNKIDWFGQEVDSYGDIYLIKIK